MKMAAMGVRMHSGWGALVVVANEDGRVNVVARERIEVIDEKAGGKRQPYHRAKNLALNEAEAQPLFQRGALALVGSPTRTSMRCGRGTRLPGGSICRVPVIATGMTGTPERRAR